MKAGTLSLILFGIACLPASAQVTSTQSRVSDVIPKLFGPNGLILPTNDVAHVAHFNSQFQSNFRPLNAALGTELTLLPIASPASGFVYSEDSATGVTTRSAQTLGPILTERAETLGKHRFFLGFTNQAFSFDSIDGNSLQGLPAVFEHDKNNLARDRDVITTSNTLDLKISQSIAFLSYGLTNRIDVSLALPMVRSSLLVSSDATIRRIATFASPLTHTFDPTKDVPEQVFTSKASASGLGDIVLRVKGTAYKTRRLGVALGADLRLPTGDETNFLGSGAVAVRPFTAISVAGRISPHVNLGYQFNGKSLLAGDVQKGIKEKLPNNVFYAAGADIGVTRNLTLVADVLGQRLFSTDRVMASTFTATNQQVFPTISIARDQPLQITSGAFGFKVNVFRNLLATGNFLVKLNDGGLRQSVVPLFGLNYTFSRL